MAQERPEDTVWQVSDPKIVFKTPVMDLVTCTVKSPRTAISKEFYRFDFPGWVNIVAVTPEEEIILIKQYRFGTGRTEVEIPGGAMEPGEDPVAAGVRELLEETGFAGTSARIIGRVDPNPAIQGNSCYTVLVENARKTSAPDQDDMEDIEVFTLPRKNVFAMIQSGEIAHGLVLNGLMFFWLLPDPVND